MSAPRTTATRRTGVLSGALSQVLCPALVPTLLAAAVAVAVAAVVPLTGPLLVALVLGAVSANTPVAHWSVMRDQARSTKLLLRLGVVLLGLQLPVQDVLAVGPSGILVVVTTVVLTYSVTVWVGDRMGLDRGFVTLVAAGFSICGAAAIAAVDDTVRAKQRDVALAVALVTVFGSALIVLLPWMAIMAGLGEAEAAVWAGASIHEVAQVVAAASVIGTGALALAMTVKLGRVVLLAPMYAVAARRSSQTGSSTALVPWFVVGFAAAIVARSVDLLPSQALAVTDLMTTVLLAAGMFGLGMGIRVREIWPVPSRAFALALVSTIVAAGWSLLLIVALP